MSRHVEANLYLVVVRADILDVSNSFARERHSSLL